MDARSELEQGRDAFEARRWKDAHDALRRADHAGALEADGVEMLATAAYMLGREDDYLAALEQAHQAHLTAGETARAVRCAFWVGVNLARRGEMGRAGGWLIRARRLLEHEEPDCVEHGYLLIPTMFRQEADGDWDAAVATAARAAEIGRRHGDQDLLALAAHEQGHVLVRRQSVAEGLELLDEAMVAATRGELSPIVTGIVYCGVILACQEAYELRRAQEWTDALTAWCDAQPEMVAFTGRCLLHRAEIMQVRGAWPAALEEARRAARRSTRAGNQTATGEARYREGEVRRLRGELADAEAAYLEASRLGREPQPGLALLRLARGETDVAAAAIRRVAEETTEPLARAGLMPAYAQIMVAVGDLPSARRACTELAQVAGRHRGTMLCAMAATARGEVELAAGDAAAALVALREAWQAWQELDAPYEGARTRVLVGLACRALGDEEAAALELGAARVTFGHLGATADLARVESLAAGAEPAPSHGLTPRELEILRLVAGGRTNREIAAELVISEHTVARHLQNMFAKLGVSTRTAAGAYAYEHRLL